MSTISQLLKDSYLESDDVKVTLKIEAPLGMIRQNSDLLAGLSAQVAGGKSAAKAPAKKTGAKRGPKPGSKRKTKAATAKKAPAKRASSGRGKARVTADAVRNALANNCSTPGEVADYINADVKQVHKGLSRWVKDGSVVRIEKGRYGLPSAA